MGILHDLYNGNITPSEKYIKDGGDYQKLLEKLTEYINSFIPRLDCESHRLWEEIKNLETEMEAISDRESFIDGFCIGARVIFEIMTEDRTNRTVL